MICHSCDKDKLSKEFPFYPLTDNCNHALLHCLDCSIESVKKNNKCSQCENTVDENNAIYKKYVKILKYLFPNEKEDIDEDHNFAEMEVVEGDITVTTLSGELATFAYHPHRTISDIKNEIDKEFKTPPVKQRLLFQDKDLKTKGESNEELTLEYFNIPSNSTLQLIVKLCDVPDDLEDLVFDFCWGLPRGHDKDYLDVSVFVYSGKSYVGRILWRTRSISDCPGVSHSGPAHMDYTKREGHHRVDISLNSVPQHIDKIVFTLSAWNSSSISSYPFRKLRFYDVNFPDQQLCTDEIHGASYRESIALCYLSRKEDKWSVISLKHGIDGCTKPRSLLRLQEEIGDLVQRGLID